MARSLSLSSQLSPRFPPFFSLQLQHPTIYGKKNPASGAPASGAAPGARLHNACRLGQNSIGGIIAEVCYRLARGWRRPPAHQGRPCHRASTPGSITSSQELSRHKDLSACLMLVTRHSKAASHPRFCQQRGTPTPPEKPGRRRGSGRRLLLPHQETTTGIRPRTPSSTPSASTTQPQNIP